MGDYLGIDGDPADIIGTATLITGAAEALKSSLGGLIGAVEALETPAVLGNDDFAREFAKSYGQAIPVGEGRTEQVNAATKDSVRTLADQAIQIGGAAGTAMTDYLVTDGLGAADIGSVST
jgi:hypothetical protein